MDRDVFDANHLMNGLLATVVVGLALVPTPAASTIAAEIGAHRWAHQLSARH